MELFLNRKFIAGNNVGGTLIIKEFNNIQYSCATVEDNIEKIKAGRYKLRIRQEGGFHNRYSERFPKIHKGMIEIIVPERLYILIHCGNTHEDTEGCLLVGTKVDEKTGFLSESVKAYEVFYPLVIKELLKGKDIYINIEDVEEPKKIDSPVVEDRIKCKCPHCGKEIVINITK